MADAFDLLCAGNTLKSCFFSLLPHLGSLYQILVFRIPAGNFRFFSHYFLFFLSFLRLAAETVGADHHFQLKMEPELV